MQRLSLLLLFFFFFIFGRPVQTTATTTERATHRNGTIFICQFLSNSIMTLFIIQLFCCLLFSVVYYKRSYYHRQNFFLVDSVHKSVFWDFFFYYCFLVFGRLSLSHYSDRAHNAWLCTAFIEWLKLSPSRLRRDMRDDTTVCCYATSTYLLFIYHSFQSYENHIYLYVSGVWIWKLGGISSNAYVRIIDAWRKWFCMRHTNAANMGLPRLVAPAGFHIYIFVWSTLSGDDNGATTQ